MIGAVYREVGYEEDFSVNALDGLIDTFFSI